MWAKCFRTHMSKMYLKRVLFHLGIFSARCACTGWLWDGEGGCGLPARGIRASQGTFSSSKYKDEIVLLTLLLVHDKIFD